MEIRFRWKWVPKQRRAPDHSLKLQDASFLVKSCSTTRLADWFSFRSTPSWQGYVKRQALYACVTCLPSSSGELAGICLACSYHCHDGHELIELYTKRFVDGLLRPSEFLSHLECRSAQELPLRLRQFQAAR